jgi:hypothetical protein
MDQNQQPAQTDRPAEPTISVTGPASPHVSESVSAKQSKWGILKHPKIMVIGLCALVVMVGLTVAWQRFGAHNTQSAKPTVNTKPAVNKESSDSDKDAPEDAATLSQQAATAPANSSTPQSNKKPTAPVAAPVPTPTPSPQPVTNTTNCLPPNPSPYATYFITKTNSQYLQTNSYVNTTKLYAALQFAGLIDTINTKQYVVLAMDDSGWNKFTPAQLNWMNASAANMRSVLGWQIIKSCITWDGVNPVKDMAIGATQVVNTLNGPVTYTHNGSGLGAFGSGQVGIWDWFTSNGSVTIAGFVDTTSIP